MWLNEKEAKKNNEKKGENKKKNLKKAEKSNKYQLQNLTIRHNKTLTTI